MAGIDIMGLSDLLNQGNEEEEARDASSRALVTPGSIVGKDPKITNKVGANLLAPKEKEGDIWGAEEVPAQEAFIEDLNDKRKTPRHEICFKQAVDSGDVFLGLSDKSPGTSDCTHIIVKAHFIDCKMKDIDLDVTKNMLKAESDDFKLRIYLPQPVDSDNGNAKFDPQTFILTVTLPIAETEW